MNVYCPLCQRHAVYSLTSWRCPCGGAWEPEIVSVFNPEKIRSAKNSLWRYSDLLDLELKDNPISLGAGWTSLLPANVYNHQVMLKLEYLNPSGSFKDRGTEVMINVFRDLGATSLVEDSSGNAGASLAAYAARAGLRADIYAPETASPVKLSQIEIYGAKVHKIPGPRVNAAEAVLQAVNSGSVYASHAYNPAYLLGQQTAVWEVWEQLGNRAPDVWVTPVGQGGHFLGIYLGFLCLKDAGLIEKLPCLVAVQSAQMDPIVQTFNQRLSALPEVNPAAKTIAEGVVVTKPVRWQRIIQALQETGGLSLAIEDKHILAARDYLARQGFFVEPTSALAIAALPEIFKISNTNDIVVVSLTGSGLKVSLQ